ncbi:TFIID-18kDa-domain-containing protein [Rhizoclosmatium globosum]|uniref:Transcription initiation factor TFIID subunit 13 n=1 Tax=Rhizoclosmatium globosum TaxID=329046 RepID=A0A1Y2CBS7_9FUNG|nr:TFIID-18kDa-domain-containing protein [Rhizoclosmatium globosum]|eukprot:ORY44304.1 TFIID-18kDa-domain-containing protein [Rhizoclosmatium globosum]
MTNESEYTTQREAEHRTKETYLYEREQIMYGNGDVLNPAEDTADVMEDMLLMFIEDLCTKTLQASSNGRLKLTDLTYVLRKDPKKLGRVLELIALDKELAKTRNAMGDEATLKGKNLGGKRMRDDDDDDGRGSGDERYEGGWLCQTTRSKISREIRIMRMMNMMILWCDFG